MEECPHQYVAATLLKPTHCDACSQFIWGLRKQAVQCKRCHRTLHHHCQMSAVHDTTTAPVIPKKADSKKVYCTEPHSFAVLSLSSPTYCSECGGFLWGLRHQGLQCVRCYWTVHEHCVPEGSERLSTEQLEDPHEDVVVSATFELLHDFQKRHGCFVSPLKLYSMYQDSTKRFQTLCSAMEEIPDKQTVVPFLRHTLRYATAAYGPAYFEGYMFTKKDTLVAQAFHKKSLTMQKQAVSDVAVATILGIPVSNIIASRWTYKTFEPCYCVILDHAKKWVVFAVRGTMSQNDVLTDVAGVVVPFSAVGYGTVHEGMSKAVDILYEDTALMNAIHSAPADYTLMVTGHSLGAAVASVFTVRALLLNTFPERKVVCNVFAPPPTVSEDIACHEGFQEAITAVVAGVDCIPRLSINSLERLGSTINDGKSEPNVQPESYIAGRVLLVTDPMVPTTKIVEVPRCSQMLMMLIMAPRMFDDHSPETYATGLDGVFKAL
eukprot:PhF_6_TR6105/c0_g1_i1/m.8980